MKTEPNHAPLSNWAFLDTTERQTLLAFNPEAESIINALDPALVCESRFFHGSNPWLPQAHVITQENATGMVEIHHPQDSSFTKWENRRGLRATVRCQYFTKFDKLVLACMAEPLRAMPWAIYQTSGNGPQHIYLNTAGPGVNGDKKVALYVPVSYFTTRNWQEVEDLHTRVAVGYYNGPGFRVEPAQLEEWRNVTASALTKPEALALRAIVEGFTL